MTKTKATGDSFKPADIAPYRPGDVLYVKETWAPFYWTEDYISVCYAADGIDKETAGSRRVLLKNPGIAKEQVRVDGGFGNIKTWRSSRFMPKWAARLFLEVKNVRVERLQEITEKDAIAEGVMQWICEEHKSGSYLDNAMRGAACAKPERAFALLWDSINGKRGFPWENNDWVWVYEFMRLSKPSERVTL